MTTFSGWLAIANSLIVICIALGGALAFRSALSKAKDDVQERVTAMLLEEKKAWQERANRLETENKRLARVLHLIVSGLKKQHNIEIDIDEDAVNLRVGGNVSRMSIEP